MRELKTIFWAVSLGIALMTTFLASLALSISPTQLVVILVITFFVSLLFTYVVIKVLIIRDIQNLESVLRDWENPPNPKASGPSGGFHFTKLRKLEDKLKRIGHQKDTEIRNLQRMADFRRQFIADISHELKTPIFSAQGFVHTLLDGAIHDKSVRNKFLKKAAKNLDGLDMLVQDLLTLSQIEIGDIKMQFEYFDISKLVAEIVEQFEQRAEKKNVFLVEEFEDIPLVVYADSYRINQVISNLISNGIKYNKEDGTVTVDLINNPDSVTVKVADDGDGIPEDDLGRIFERFYRVDKSRSRAKGGTGLGLAIVKHIIDRHGSEINVVSRLGKGSVFSFDVPKSK